MFQARLASPAVQSDRLYLVGYGGNAIAWNGITLGIPAGWSVSVSNAGLQPNRLYYVYVRANNGAPALELSEAGHATDSNGNEVKAGDPSRLLAGMIFTDAQGMFRRDAQHATILNWFNRLPIFAAPPAAGVVVQTADWSELGQQSENRIEILTWGYQLGVADCFTVGINGAAALNQNGARGDVVFGDLALGPDVPCSSWIAFTSASANQWQNISSASTWGLPEGHRTLTFWGRTYGGALASIYVNMFASTNG